jgi:hypothetical protein
MKRTVIAFSLRHYSEIALDVMADRVGRAMGCTFHESDLDDMPGVVSGLLGTNVVLYDTRGLGNAVVYILSNWVTDARFGEGPGGEEVDIEILDLNQALIDLLAVHGVGAWHRPSADEIQAERAHATRRSQRIDREIEAEAERRRQQSPPRG